MTKLAIAVEPSKHPAHRQNYRIWYLELNSTGDVISIGVKSREELIKSMFSDYKKTGKSSWRAFRKNETRSTQIDLMDFVSQNMFENTHFGELPTLGEFQSTLDHLQMSLELRSIA